MKHTEEKGYSGVGSRRSFLKILSLATPVRPLAGYGKVVPNPQQPERIALTGSAQAPAWTRDGVVAAWVTLGYYPWVRHGVGLDADFGQNWNKGIDEATIRLYKEMGINLIVLLLLYGGGIKAEAETIEASRKATEIAHRCGIKVAGYVGSTLE